MGHAYSRTQLTHASNGGLYGPPRVALISGDGQGFWVSDFSSPVDLLDGTHKEIHAGGSYERDDGDDEECPVEVTGASDDEAGDSWGDDTCKVAESVLEADPASRGLWSRKALGDGEDISG